MYSRNPNFSMPVVLQDQPYATNKKLRTTGASRVCGAFSGTLYPSESIYIARLALAQLTYFRRKYGSIFITITIALTIGADYITVFFDKLFNYRYN